MKALIRSMIAAAGVLVTAVPARAALQQQSGEVTGVSVVPAPGRAELVVAVSGTVEVKDFVLRNPDRLVLDLSGARLTAGSVNYDGVVRGGVQNVRTSQYQSDVVRVVVDFDALKDYSVTREDGAVRVSFGSERTFLGWSSAVPAAPALAVEPAPAPAVEPAVVADAVQAIPVRAAIQAPVSGSTLSRDEPRITVSWDRASIADVVTGFAAFSGRNIILGKDIKGEVTAEIRNQPWPEAFAAILAAQGLTAQEMQGGIIRVDAPATLAALDSLEPLETRVVRLNYKQADSLVKTVESVVTKNRGRVVATSSSNALVITDTRSRIQNVVDFVTGMDLRTPQVSIQAKIIFVDRRNLEQLGLKYDLGSRTQFFNKLIQRNDPSGDSYDANENIIDLGGNSLSGIANADASITGSAIDLVFSTAIGGFSLTSFLSALERVELSDVQAEPLITTLDNQQADILVGDEIPLRVVDASAQSGAGTGTARSTVQFKETGIRLTVTPHVTNNRQILMQLKTERSSVQTLAAADLGFTIQKQQATNQLLVNDGETSVIGGLTVTTVTRSRSGIPLLSGLPVIGKMFSYSSDDESRRDLIILVTPRIVDDGVTTP
ncbi:MAG TPA: AMIN domain-containing protein [Gemmatimonadales bacterium]|nr:AMIN domain-containing protein [Gemmatimonadales bacterium]